MTRTETPAATRRRSAGGLGPGAGLGRGARALGAAALLLLAAAAAEAGIWTTFGRNQGLPGDQVRALAGTDSGTVLVAVVGAASDSIVEYDGVRFRNLSRRYAQPPDLGIVTSLAAGPDGNLWVGTLNSGVFRLGLGSARQFTKIDGLGDRRIDRVKSILVEPNGTVWAGMGGVEASGGGLSRLAPGDTVWTTFTTADGLPSMFVSDLALDAAGRLWFTSDGSPGGLVRYDGSSFTTFVRPGGASGINQLSKLAMAPDGKIWVTSSAQGGAVFDADGTWLRDFTTADGLVSNFLGDLSAGPFGALWVATANSGLQHWDGATWNSLTTSSSGIPDNTVSSVHVDPAGVLWVGTAGGLARYEGSLWLTLKPAHGLASNSIRALARPSAAPAGATVGVTRGATYVAGGNDAFGNLGGLVRVQGLSAVSILGNTRVNALSATSTGVWTGYTAFANSQFVLIFAKVDGTTIVRADTVPADAVNGNEVLSVQALDDGTAWLGTTHALFRFDGSAWVRRDFAGFTPTTLGALAVDGAGQVWAGSRSNRALIRIDPVSGAFQAVGTAEGLPSSSVQALFVAANGDVWVGTDLGAARIRGTTVDRVVTTADGIPSNVVRSIGEDQRGRIWLGTNSGIAYEEGSVWVAYGTADGVPSSIVRALLADTSETLVGSDAGGLALFRRDGVAPRASILAGPPPVLAGRLAQVVFTGGDLDSRPDFVRFSWSLDGGPRRPFSSDNNATLLGLADGPHVFEVWARDRALNVTAEPARHFFEIDATPPQPLMARPTFGSVLSGTVSVVGDANDTRFAGYRVDMRSQFPELGKWQVLAQGATLPTAGEPLAQWNTLDFPDGGYELRLAVTDTLGLVGYAIVEVLIDNLEPRNDVTSPARVHNANGGRVFTLNGEVEAYFPPQALDQDRIVAIQPIAEPAPLPPGGQRWLAGWRLTPAEFALKKPVTLSFSLAALDSALQAGGALPPGVRPAIFALQPDSSLTFLGGSVDANSGALVTTVEKLGSYGIYLGLFGGAAARGERDLDVQPRAFSPKGNTFDDRAAVSFTLIQGSDAKVFVYDRAGRLVRRVFEGALGAGRNVVYWDGRDGRGEAVPSGLYLVTLQAEGGTDVKSVAVVNR